jgi:hypothetical protein
MQPVLASQDRVERCVAQDCEIRLRAVHRLLPFGTAEEAVSFSFEGLDVTIGDRAYPHPQPGLAQALLGRIEVGRAESRHALLGGLLQERMLLEGGEIGGLASQRRLDLARFTHPCVPDP